MRMVKAIDAGNFETKYYDGKVMKKFPSALGGWRERRLKNQQGEYDFEYEFKGKKGFAGTLAESETISSSKKGISKVHEEALIRILLALHYFSDDTEHQIVVGQPILSHTEDEKKKYKELVHGRHEFTVNGVKKSIIISRVEVAAEGVAVGLLAPTVANGTVRVIDVGSGTVNLGTIRNLRFLDRDSTTFIKGAENINESDEEFARIIANMALDMWEKDDAVRVCGGGGKKLFKFLKAYFPNAELMADPVFSNVNAFYALARKIYG